MKRASESPAQDSPSGAQFSPIAISSVSTESTSPATQQASEQPPAGGAQQDGGLPPGYPKLAERMAVVPEIAVFRRFGFMNKLNLLYLQAELMDIEDQLKHLQKEDCKKSGYEQYYATDWFYFKERDHPQLRLILDAREKLEKYNTAIIQQSYILGMKPPGGSDLDYIQKYLASRHMGPFALDGLDAEVWGTIKKPKGYEPDIVALLPRPKEDMFSNLIMGKGMEKWFKWGFDRFRKPSINGLVEYEESTLLRLTSLVSTVLASLLPIASIVVLYSVHSMKARLGIIAAFNVLISLSLAIFTTAKRTDIFAVVAAFSAVQVVFVQVGGDCSGWGE